MIGESGGREEIAVPPTIQALLQARLDRLGSEERDVIGRGTVEGQVFHRGVVQELATESERRRRPDPPADTRAERRDPARPGDVRGRRRVPFPPPAHPRRRLRRAAEGDARRAARALRRLARAGTPPWSSRTRSSGTTSSAPTETGPSSTAPIPVSTPSRGARLQRSPPQRAVPRRVETMERCAASSSAPSHSCRRETRSGSS